jgi:hypothetical protein
VGAPAATTWSRDELPPETPPWARRVVLVGDKGALRLKRSQLVFGGNGIETKRFELEIELELELETVLFYYWSWCWV